MKNITKFLIFISIFLLLFVPAFSFAQEEPPGTCILPPGTTSYKPPASSPECTALGGQWFQNLEGIPSSATSSPSTTLTPADSNASSASSSSTSPTSTSSSSTSSSRGLVPPCPATGCGWNELLALVNKVINFILFGMAVPIAAIMFVYAGFLLITAGGEAASARTKAKSIFTNVVIGLVIAVAAWLIISTILHILGYNGDWIGLKIGV